MKKYLTILLTLFFVTSEASAKDSFYVGVDGIWSHVRHKFKGQSDDYSLLFEDPNRPKVDADDLGIGSGLGYKFEHEKFYIAPEIFFDYFNNKAPAFNFPNWSNAMIVRYRYGMKVNFGYNINEKFSALVNYGVALVDYDVHFKNMAQYGLPSSYGEQTSSQLYGAGLIYNINTNWAAKLAYDHQTSNLRYIYRGLNSKARIETTRLGLIYNF